jgi:hypothetical protein
MPTLQVPAQLTVDHLLQAIQQLSPAELQQFMCRFEEWQRQNGVPADEETALIEATKERLPAADERRLNRLGRKSERGTLSSKEWDEYRSLAQQSEQLDVRRVEALAKLAQRRGKPVPVIMKEIGWRSGNDDT